MKKTKKSGNKKRISNEAKATGLKIVRVLLIVWLVLLLVVNTVTAIAFLGFNAQLRATEYLDHVPAEILYIYGVLAAIMAACAVALLKKRKWGFYVYVLANLIPLGVNIYRKLSIEITIIAFMVSITVTFLLLLPFWKEMKK